MTALDRRNPMRRGAWALVIAAAVAGAAVAGARFETFRGHYVFGHEVRSFQPCGSDRIYWVQARRDVADRLRDAHGKLTKKPYEPIFVEFNGRAGGNAESGFAAGYDGVITVDSVTAIRQAAASDCDAP